MIRDIEEGTPKIAFSQTHVGCAGTLDSVFPVPKTHGCQECCHFSESGAVSVTLQPTEEPTVGAMTSKLVFKSDSVEEGNIPSRVGCSCEDICQVAAFWEPVSASPASVGLSSLLFADLPLVGF